jgi:hypothetical protein
MSQRKTLSNQYSKRKLQHSPHRLAQGRSLPDLIEQQRLTDCLEWLEVRGFEGNSAILILDLIRFGGEANE